MHLSRAEHYMIAPAFILAFAVPSTDKNRQQTLKNRQKMINGIICHAVMTWNLQVITTKNHKTPGTDCDQNCEVLLLWNM